MIKIFKIYKQRILYYIIQYIQNFYILNNVVKKFICFHNYFLVYIFFYKFIF